MFTGIVAVIKVKGRKMEQVLLKLAESAANGGWPAAFAIAVTAMACMGAVFAVCWFWVALVSSR
jgi:hypothetical protein